ncbi:MAG: hypothetical protein BACD_04211 [Bacteroides rodentium]
MIMSLLRKTQRSVFNAYCDYIFWMSLVGSKFNSHDSKYIGKKCAMYIITILKFPTPSYQLFE